MIDFIFPIAQILLAIALGLVAILCLRLDRKLNAMKEGKDGIAAAAAELAQAVARAEASVKALKSSSEMAASDLQAKIDAARSAADALTFLTSTTRALEPRATPARTRWEDEDHRPARREPPATERWSGLR